MCEINTILEEHVELANNYKYLNFYIVLIFDIIYVPNRGCLQQKGKNIIKIDGK